ncbi:hypothetical protein SCHPADRAFT_797738, partial [Schizopora paradoxa]
FTAVAELGLKAWRPDFSDGARSLYNYAHETVFLETFTRVVSLHGYAFMGVPQSAANDISFIKRAYLSFVFSYLADLAKKEARDPGRVERGSYLIHHIEGRAKKVGIYFRDVDTKRLRAASRDRTTRRTERIRVTPFAPIPSPFTTLPVKTPLDWFDPDFWNNEMTLLQKYRVQMQGIAIALPAEELCHASEWHKWIKMDHAEFMQKHGLAELQKYKLLSLKQMQDMAELDERL